MVSPVELEWRPVARADSGLRMLQAGDALLKSLSQLERALTKSPSERRRASADAIKH